MRTDLYITAVIALMLLAGCQNGQPKDSTPEEGMFFGELYLRYITPQQQYSASASFRQGDSLETAENISLDQIVRFQSEEMEVRQLPQGITRYHIDKKAAYTSGNTFEFSLPEGNTTRLDLDLPPIDSFEIVGGKASLGNGMELLLHGTSLKDGERLVLLFTDEANKAESITLPGPQFEDTIKLHPLRLRKLHPGPYQLYLVRKITQDTTLQGIRLRSAAEFYTDSRRFEVVD